MIFAKSLLRIRFIFASVTGLNVFTIFVVTVVLMHVGGSCSLVGLQHLAQ